MRRLRLGDDQLATLVVSDDRPGVVRVAIERSTTDTRYDIQFSQTGLPLVAGHTYVLSFLARADRPRTIGVGVARSKAPWSNLGFYEEVELTDVWHNWERTFTATDSDDDARVHYDVGGDDASVEVSAVFVRSLTDGQVLTFGPHRPAMPAVVTQSTVPLGEVDFDSLRRVRPISGRFGLDRGTPVDRHYIEAFLERHRGDVRGHVLEIGDATYTRRFGGAAVTRSDVLHVAADVPEATIIADLTDASNVADDSFDCIILTQTLQLIYALDAAVATLHRILKPGGVLLATCPGVTQTYDGDWGDTWCWSMTPVSARRLFGSVFGAGQIAVKSHGNVLAATAFLHGLAKEELTASELDHHDPGYPVTVTVRAIKAVGAGMAATTTATSAAAAPTILGARTSSPSVAVLAYHRIVDDDVDPWSLSVAPERFAEQLAAVREYAMPLTLADALTRLQDGTLDRQAVVVTFDDGYADNLYNALPILERFDMPATVFVTSGAIDAAVEFWWDALEQLVLHSGLLPAELTLVVNGIDRQWSVDNLARQPRRRSDWTVDSLPPTGREALYLDLWRLLQPLSHDTRQGVLADLQRWTQVVPEVRASRRTLSSSQLQSLAASPLIEIGAHSVTHPVLAALPPHEQLREIAESKTVLEGLVHCRVDSFAYPFGATSPSTMQAVAAAGFDKACTTVPKPTTAASPRLAIPRFVMRQSHTARSLSPGRPGPTPERG